MRNPSDTLIVALDGSLDEAQKWTQECRGIAGWVKIGMTLYYAEGPKIVEAFTAQGFNVFLDLKLYDISHQVENAAYELGKLGVGMFTVHASGGPEMMRAAKRGSAKGAIEAGLPEPTMLAVTVLTSFTGEDLFLTGLDNNVPAQVFRLAKLALENDADGIVCSPQEASFLRSALGNDFAIVTPGVRPSWASADDQRRITTPSDAISYGSTHLVVGRPITGHESPKIAAQSVLDEITEALA